MRAATGVTVTGRKLRPISLAEVSPEFAESVGLDEACEQIRMTLEPDELGAGTPDGNIMLIRALQSWAMDMDTSNQEALTSSPEELDAILALDLTNAYGLFYRSGAMQKLGTICRF